MTKTSLAIALALSTALATPVFAQDANQQMQNQAAPAATDTNAAPAATTAGQAGGAQFITQAQQGEFRASKFVGLDIYNNNDENIGEVNEIILDKSGNAKAIVIGVGGFLGLGEKNVALPFDAIQWVDQPRATAANTAPPVANNGTGGAGTASGTGVVDNGTGTASNMNNAAGTANTMANSTTAAANNTANTMAGNDTTGAVANANVMRDTPDHGLLNMTKDQLKAAPEFKYASDAR